MQLSKTAERTFNEYANEKMQVEIIKRTVYGYGSELACLRIFAKYNANGAVHNKNIRV